MGLLNIFGEHIEFSMVRKIESETVTRVLILKLWHILLAKLSNASKIIVELG